MKPIKSEQIAFRVSPEEKAAAEEIAAQLKTTAGALSSALLEEFVAARKQHGSRLIWPPEFNYYPAGTMSAQEGGTARSDIGNASSKRKAG